MTEKRPWTYQEDQLLSAYTRVVGSRFAASHDLGRDEDEGPARYRYLRRIGWWKRLQRKATRNEPAAYAREVLPHTPTEPPRP